MTCAARTLTAVAVAAAIGAMGAMTTAVECEAQADRAAITGAWTLNKDLSDHPPDRGDGTRGDRGGYGGYGGGGRHRGGGFGAGGHGGRGGGQPQLDPETMQRVREAVRDITNPPEKITITQTDSMVVVTTADGRTTRLSPDGKKIKEENTGIERKTKWEGGRLVTEISGPNGIKVTQTYALAPELHQLRLTTQIEGGRGGQARTISSVYDADKR